MLSIDTNILVHAANKASPLHQRAYDFVASLGERRDVAVCELMLVELYLKLRNARIFTNPLSAAQATAVCRQYRKNRSWMLIGSAPTTSNTKDFQGLGFTRVWNPLADPR